MILRYLISRIPFLAHRPDRVKGPAFMIMLAISGTVFAQEPASIDSIKRLVQAAPADSTRVNLLDDLCWEYMYYDPQKSIPYATEAITLAKKISFLKGEGRLLNTLGVAYSNLGSYDKALSNYRQALMIKERIGDLRGKASTIINIGNTLQFKGYYDSAIRYYMLGLPLLEQLNNKPNLADTYNNISAVYEFQESFSNMLTYAEKGMVTATEANYDAGMMNSNILIGNVRKHTGNYQEALNRYEAALDIATRIKDTFGMTTCYHNLAGTQLKLGNIPAAKANYGKQLALAGELNSPNDSLYAIMGTGETLLLEKKYSESRPYFFKALLLSKRLGARNETKQIYEQLSRLFQGTKDYSMALEYQRLFTALKDSLFSESKSKQIQELAVRYETEKKEKEIAILNRSNALQNLEIGRAQLIRNFLIAGAVLLFGVAVLLYVNIRQRNTANRLLLVQKQELEQSNQVRTKLFSIISHDLRNPVASLQALMQIVKEKNVAGLKPLTDHADTMINGTMNLIDNLLYWSLSQANGITLQASLVDLFEIVEESKSQLAGVAGSKSIDIHNQVRPNQTAYVDRPSIELVLRNLITNAIKFTPAGGNISITTSAMKNEFQVSVADTGIGMSDEQAAGLFTKEKVAATAKTKSSGAGLGLVLCKEFIEKNGGRIWVEKNPGGGSIFKFTVPAYESPDPNLRTNFLSTTNA